MIDEILEKIKHDADKNCGTIHKILLLPKKCSAKERGVRYSGPGKPP